MLSAIFSRMENKTVEIEEMEKVATEAQVIKLKFKLIEHSLKYMQF